MKILPLLALLTTSISPALADISENAENRSDAYSATCRTAIEIAEERKQPPKDQDDLMRYAIDSANCLSYIKGFIDGHNMTADHPGNSPQFCIPRGVSYIQIARIIVKSSEERPDIGHHPRETLLEYSIKSAWPCTTRTK